MKVGRPQWKLGFPPHRRFLTLGFLCRREKLSLSAFTGKENTHEHRQICEDECEVWLQFIYMKINMQTDDPSQARLVFILSVTHKH